MKFRDVILSIIFALIAGVTLSQASFIASAGGPITSPITGPITGPVTSPIPTTPTPTPTLIPTSTPTLIPTPTPTSVPTPTPTRVPTPTPTRIPTPTPTIVQPEQANVVLSTNNLTTAYVPYSINFGKTYRSIGMACFNFTFENDLLDQNEGSTLTLTPAPARFGYGFNNQKAASLSTISMCLTPAHSGFNEFLKGRVNGSIKMSRGTARIRSIVIVLNRAVRN